MKKKSKHLLNLRSDQRSFFYVDWIDNQDGTHTLVTMLNRDKPKLVESHETIASKEYFLMKMKGEI